MADNRKVAPGHWSVGEAEVRGLIDAGELEYVEPSEKHAELLMEQAEGHLKSAEMLVDRHPPSAYSLLYEGARKALTAVLARQGLRPTSKNGHRAVQEAVEAQLGANARRLVREFRNLRIRRHDSEYPAIETPPVTEDETRAALGEARMIVTHMRRFLPQVGPF